MRSLERATSFVSAVAAWIGGASFFALCFFITIDVLGRRFGGPYSGVTDEISSYALAIGGTLGLAHAMRIGAHVRVDLLLPRFPPSARYFLNMANGATIAFFAILLAWYGWVSTLYSLDIDARSITVIRTPLFIPQSLMAISFTLLATQATVLVADAFLKLFTLGKAEWAETVPGDAEPEAEEMRVV